MNFTPFETAAGYSEQKLNNTFNKSTKPTLSARQHAEQKGWMKHEFRLSHDVKRRKKWLRIDWVEAEKSENMHGKKIWQIWAEPVSKNCNTCAACVCENMNIWEGEENSVMWVCVKVWQLVQILKKQIWNVINVFKSNVSVNSATDSWAEVFF